MADTQAPLPAEAPTFEKVWAMFQESMSDEVRDYAHKAGFYVIEQTGDTVRINIPEGFKAREW